MNSTLKLVKTSGAMRCLGVYQDGKYAEIWKNGNNNFFWLRTCDGKNPPKNLMGWKSYIEAETQFSRQIYNLEIYERKFND